MSDGYSDEDHPLGGYAALVALYGALVAVAALAFRRSGRALPERVPPQDVLLVGVATHKLSRLVAKDRVLSPLRAPFTRYQGPAGEGEVDEEARGTGLRRAVGELVICPYCLGLWVATAFSGGLVVARRATRLVAAVFAVLSVSDALQLAYRAGKKST